MFVKSFLPILFLNIAQILADVQPSRNGKSNVFDEESSEKSSLAFVFDTTGSMYNDLRQLREGAEMILKTALEDSNIIEDFVFVPFHDPSVGPATVTKDKEVFKSVLNIVRVYGGGDCPEKSLGGIQMALNVSRARSFIYVFTDATASDHRLVGKVLDSVQRKQSQVVFVLTGHCNDLHRPHYKVYEQIAAASAGQLFSLNKTNVHRVLDFVRSSIKGRTVNLGSAVNRKGYNYTQNIPVDSTLGEVTVSVSGDKPSIKVVNPRGEELTGPPQLVTTLDLNEIMVVKVLQPEPGNWSITTGSAEEHSVRVVGLSDVSFSHGFAVQRPAAPGETSYRPLRGTYNHLLISLSGVHRPLAVQYAEILSLEGRTLFEIPLHAVDSQRNVYLAAAFVPPDEFFNIAINGKDEYNQEFRRIGATAVQAKSPDVPYLTAARKVEARSHDAVVLRCDVESLVPVTASWTKDSSRLQPLTSSLQSMSIEYVIEDMSEGDGGIYRCVANNVAGVSEATTEVILLVDPPLISFASENKSVEMGDNVTISCSVTSEVLLSKYQIVFNGSTSYAQDIPIEPNVDGLYVFNKTIYNVTERDSGVYTCLASNRGGTINQTFHLNVQNDPIAQILGPHTLTKLIHTDIQLVCNVENADRLVWLDDRGTVLKSFIVNGLAFDMLEVKNISGDGSWSCVAVKGRKNVTDVVEVTVLIKPEVVIEGSRNITILNGSSVDIECRVVARPPPRIIWHRETERFLNHTVTQLEPNVYKSVLTLNSGREKVEGVYFCFGENSEGIHQDSAIVSVREKMVLLRGFNDTAVQLYSQVQLYCQVTSYPPPLIHWFHNGTLIKDADNMYISENNTTLTIMRVNFNSLGSFTCNASNGFESLTVDGRLDVVGLERPLISKERNVITTQKGKSAIIPCRLTNGNPQPTITWLYKTDASATTSLPEGIITSPDNTELIILNVDTNHNGFYMCSAENILGTDVFNISLVVQYPPEILAETVDGVAMRVEAGRKMSLRCRASGVPPPLVTWRREDLPVRYSRNIYLSEAKELVIQNATEYDSGVYSCVASNALGSTVKNFTVVVYEAPKIAEREIDPDVVVLEGGVVELPCHAAGVPRPARRWLHNDVPLTNGRKLVDEFGLRFIANVTDFGEYTCLVENEFGNDSVSYFVYIWVPPTIEPPLEVSKSSLVGEGVNMTCDAVGFPVPTIFWTFRDQLLTENSTDLSFNEYGNLYIANVSSTREGAYACVAENEGGVARKTFYLKVYEPAKIIDDNYTGPYLATDRDTELVVSCRASGTPWPLVVWTKDGSYLDTDDGHYKINVDGSLIIRNPSEELSGEYTCTAQNPYGTTNKTVVVEIYPIFPSQIQSDDPQNSITVVEGASVIIDCPARYSELDNVKWYKDAQLISTGRLTLANVTRHNSTTYACVVTNSIGSTYSTITLDVQWRPHFVDVVEKDKNNDVNIDSQYIKGENMEDENYDTRATDRKTAGKNASENIEGENIGVKQDTPNAVGGKRAVNIEIGGEEFKAKKSGGEESGERIQDEQSESKGINGERVVNLISGSKKMEGEKHSDETLETEEIGNKNATGNKAGEHNAEGGRIMYALRGEDVYLGCESDARPEGKTKWQFKARPLLGRDTPRLKLLNVQRRDAGVYKCTVSNEHGSVSRQFTLDVLEPPFISEFDLLDVQLREGAHAALDCNAKGSPTPTVTWTFNNTNWEVHNTSLVATNASQQSEGVFRCDATNEAGATHLVYRVAVIAPARVGEIVLFRESRGGEVVDKSVEVTENTAIRLSCSASGNPEPTVQWLRNGDRLSQNTAGIRYADLVLENVEGTHSGVYICVAANEAGSQDKRIRIDVLEPPRIFQELSGSSDAEGNARETKLEVLLGQAFYLHCHPYGNPVPVIYWFKDDLPLRLFDDTMVSKDYGEVLVSNAARVDQSGNYTCVARNTVGSTSAVYLVDVLIPPPISKESSHLKTTRAGKPLNLTCPVDGSPTPTVSWVKHPYVDITEDLPRIQFSDNNFSLIMNKTEVSDSGKYSCVMTNKVGTTEVIFDVVIEKTPSIASNVGNSMTESRVVPLRRSVVLQCEADGNPTPKITWLKDTQQLSNQSSIQRVAGASLLSVFSAGTRDAGQYICVAENSAGTAHRRYNLVIQVPGKWSRWSAWGWCNVTCGLGYQHRSRLCHYVDDRNVTYDKNTKSDKIHLDDSNCKGSATDKRKCHMPPCEDEKEMQWSRWSRCSATCGGGVQARSRRCLRAAPCSGDNVQIRKCPNLPKCSFETERAHSPTDNEVFDSKESSGEINAYAPEVTFEMQPEVVNRDRSYATDLNESYSYIRPERKYATVYYEVNVTDNLDGSVRGSCDPGFQQNNETGACDDVDECAVARNRCHASQLCANTAGGYRCACPAGYAALGAGQRCMDINECEQDIHGCEFACVNTAGGYVCACPTNLRLHTDKHRCVSPASYRRRYSYEDLESEGYLATTIDFPARYMKHRD